ncbi:30S ribosomal protein S6e [Candidatus Woesearchaeota archaeon]|nr:30S ribosomal protein S6e [Candidatus Woesearchaeota archaeon]
MAIRIVMGTKDGKSAQKELNEQESAILVGKVIGDKVSGDSIGVPGYEFMVTGGSDYCGFPMRRDVSGPMRKRILAVDGVGLSKEGKGIRIRKTVCGNQIHDKTAQVNLKVEKAGPEPLPHTPAKKQ